MTRNRPRADSRPLFRFVRRCAPAALLALAPITPSTAQVFEPGRPDIAAFVADVSQRNGFEPGPLAELLARAESRPAILQAIARPAERTLSWDEYRAKFLVERRIARGAQVYAEQQAALQRVEAASGVPADVMLGIVGVETFYGENTGRHRVLDALATLAFDYPPRADYFRRELEQYLLMAREEKLDPLAPLGSYAGAMGIPQFMPTSFRQFAVDGDGDGLRDLWKDWPDVFASVGNYLKGHGWKAGEPVMAAADVTGADLNGLGSNPLQPDATVGSLRARGIKFQTELPADATAVLVPLSVGFGTEYRVGFANFCAIARYNRSVLYASAVNDLADAIRLARATPRKPGSDRDEPAVAAVAHAGITATEILPNDHTLQ